MRFRPTILVPAAGRGSRFAGLSPQPAAGHKLAQTLGGATVLGTTLRQAVQTQLPVLCVTTEANAGIARQQLALRDVLVLGDEQAAQGMGHTLALAVAERSGAPGWLVLPGDMPMVRPATLLAVAAQLEHHAVAFAQHKGRRGHPVGFAAELYSELVLLTGDDGARRVMLRYPAFGVEVDDPGVLQDVDTPADLESLRTLLGQGAAAK
jgi:molybdenum cofactor cytidylyltransferase